VTAFLTPIGPPRQPADLNPGQYTFGDFFRVGCSAHDRISLVSAWLAQWLWLKGPFLPTW
jgi:di/tricarboxylate transporter